METPIYQTPSQTHIAIENCSFIYRWFTLIYLLNMAKCSSSLTKPLAAQIVVFPSLPAKVPQRICHLCAHQVVVDDHHCSLAGNLHGPHAIRDIRSIKRFWNSAYLELSGQSGQTYCKYIYIYMYIYIYIHTLHYFTLHYITLYYSTLQYTILHYITLHYTTLQYSTVHCISLHFITLHTYIQTYEDIYIYTYDIYVGRLIYIYTYIDTYIHTYLYIYIENIYIYTTYAHKLLWEWLCNEISNFQKKSGHRAWPI